VFAGWHQIGGSDTTYAVVGVGDYFGNNTSDILFRNGAGDTWFEAISNGISAGWNQIGGSDAAYGVPNVLARPRSNEFAGCTKNVGSWHWAAIPECQRLRRVLEGKRTTRRRQ
jgi:hypothetical protein